jgi:hypothetical protein
MQFSQHDLETLEKALMIAIKSFETYCDKNSDIEFQEILSRIQDREESNEN